MSSSLEFLQISVGKVDMMIHNWQDEQRNCDGYGEYGYHQSYLINECEALREAHRHVQQETKKNARERDDQSTFSDDCVVVSQEFIAVIIASVGIQYLYNREASR